jgi:hypothetical protein
MTHRPWLALLAALAILGLAPACGDDDGGTGNDGGLGPDSGPGPDAGPADAGPPGRLTAIWANEGGDKVVQGELRVGQPNGRPVTGSVWDGTTVTLAAARNEVVSFVLVLEAADQTAPGVQVAFDTLTGPGGATIQSQAATGDGVFSWVGRPIELFHVRYLQIRGLSRLGYENYSS